jgi:hypothetical protein
MIGAIIGLILLMIVLGVMIWGGKRLVALIPLDEPFKTIVYVLFVILTVVIVIYVIIQLLAIAGIHVPMFGGLK